MLLQQIEHLIISDGISVAKTDFSFGNDSSFSNTKKGVVPQEMIN